MVIVQTWGSVNCYRLNYAIAKQGLSDPPEQVRLPDDKWALPVELISIN